MKSLAMRSAGQASEAFRFPAHSIAGRAGTSFKHEHLEAILADERRDRFFEVHAENYMGAGGPPHAALKQIRQDYPVSLHGVCMSIGGPQPLDRAHLQRFNALVDRYEPVLVSEHLAWSTHGTTHFNDLLPLPYTATSGFAIAAIGLEGCDNILHDDAIAALARDGALFWPSRQASSLLGSSSRERPLHGPP